MTIHVPPLRSRPEDVPTLFNHYVNLTCQQNGRSIQVDPDVIKHLVRYRWPGNVRELKHLAQVLVGQVNGGALITSELLPPYIFQKVSIESEVTNGDSHEAELCSMPTGNLEEVFNQRTARTLECVMSSANGEPFWSYVYPRFMARELSRGVLLELVKIGLKETRGQYKALVRRWGMSEGDYKRFLNFLRKHQCHIPYAGFRKGRQA
jgi:DNA-binding NtrC family response regulator